MIKECPVIVNNDAVTVVRFGDIDVQLPSIKKDTKTVNVKFDNGKYSVVDHAETEPVVIEKTEPVKIQVRKPKKQSRKKHEDLVDVEE